MNQRDSQPLSIWIDARDCITRLSRHWDDFARENDGLDCLSENVVGRPIMHFLSGDEIRHLYRSLFARVRLTGVSISLPFRCDAPSLRRFMRMHLIPQPSDGIELRTETLRTEPRSEVRLLDRRQPRSEQFLYVCSWCRRIQVESGWVDAEHAITSMGLFDEPALPQMSHGVCPKCFDEVHNKLNADRP